MMHTLENSKLKLTVNPSGAELWDFYSKTTDTQYLWQGDSKYWPRRAPILFPIVGPLQQGFYTHNGNKYSLPQHGFARDMVFEFMEQESINNTLVFKLQWNETTLKSYPFKFELQVTYSLNDDVLLSSWEVFNKGPEAMPFSIGAHPAFNCPIYADEKFEDYMIQFEGKKDVKQFLIMENIEPIRTERITKEDGTIDLTDDMFENGSMATKYAGPGIRIIHKTKGHGVRLGFDNVPWTLLWTKPGAPFLCIEPWQGITEHGSNSDELRNKVEIKNLAPEASFKFEYTMECINSSN